MEITDVVPVTFRRHGCGPVVSCRGRRAGERGVGRSQADGDGGKAERHFAL